MSVDTSNVAELINEFRTLQAKDSITPDSLGLLLQKIAAVAADGVSADDIAALRETVESQLAIMDGKVDAAVGEAEYLNWQINPLTEATGDWEEGYIITSTGTDPVETVSFTPKIQSPYRHRILRCKPGDRFLVKMSGGAYQGRTWNFLTADRRVISQSWNAVIDEEITAPEEAYYLVINSTVAGGTFKTLSGAAERKTLNILCFGNSFTEDSMGYVPMILGNIAPEADVTIGIAYIGGCSLQQHLANAKNGEVTHDGTTYTPADYTYHKSAHGLPWASKQNMIMGQIIDDCEWDIITFQQNGSMAHLEWSEVIFPYLKELHRLVAQKLAKPVRYGWLLTQGAYLTTDAGLERHWSGTASNAQMVESRTGSVVFPFGTAVQNLRNTDCKNLGDGSAHNMTVDNGHLQEGIGCYAAALANTLRILRLMGIEKRGVIGDPTRITDGTLNAANVPGQHRGTGIIGMTDDNKYLAQMAATAAIQNPYAITNVITGAVTPIVSASIISAAE